jgi:hypothetical protein
VPVVDELNETAELVSDVLRTDADNPEEIEDRLSITAACGA